MPLDLDRIRAQQRYTGMQRDKALVQQGAPTTDFSAAGPPTWDRASWDAFHAQHGRYPFSAQELPPSMDGCPAWAFDLMGLRQPPIQVNNSV